VLYSICMQMFLFTDEDEARAAAPICTSPSSSRSDVCGHTHLLLVAGRQRRGNERRRGIAQKIENHEAARKTSFVTSCVKQTVEKHASTMRVAA